MSAKILIVDDEPDILQIFRSALVEEGYEVSCASNGEEALQIYRTEPFDLVITDMKMPRMDGLELLKRIKELDESSEVIIEQYIDTPVYFDELSKMAPMMRSSGMIAMNENCCMVDVARCFINFLADESCGKCVPCRKILRHLKRILKKITDRNGEEDDFGVAAAGGRFRTDQNAG